QVGGDFYDVIALDDGRIAVVIADVADKGMPAALYMALARSLILAEARQHDSPVAVLENVNRLLLELGERDMFVTVFYGILDPQQGRLAYARAGHDHPFILRDGRVITLGGHGMALGLFGDDLFTLTDHEHEVRHGDRLVLFTDGLTDIMDPRGDMLSLSRLTELALTHAGRPPEEMCRALFDDLTAFREGASQFDDMAL